MADLYQQMGYGARQVGFGHRPAIVVVDFQTASLNFSRLVGA
jgi:hypothetical protein